MPTARVGLKPNTRMRIGVISDPPPIPVNPTSAPISRPVTESCQVICDLPGDGLSLACEVQARVGRRERSG